MLLLLCFAAAYAIHGAATQAWSDGTTAARHGVRRVREGWGSAVKKGRTSESRAVRFGAALGQGVVLVCGGTIRAGWGTGRALWTGGRRGWGEGRRRGVRRWARRRVAARRCRREQERAAQEALWGSPKPPEPRTPPVSTTPPPAPPAASDPPAPVTTAPEPDPDDDPPTPTDPPPEPPPAPRLRAVPPPWQGPTPKETPLMAPTGEATDLRSALAQVGEIHAQGTTHLDTAAAASKEAADLTQAAERLEARLATARMDDASRGAVARMKERAAALAHHAEALAALADGMVASCNDATEAISAWIPVAERMRALGATPDSEFVAGGMATSGRATG